MALDDIQVIGAANLTARTRTNASGASKTRYAVVISGDSVLVNTDPKSLGKGPAEAIAKLLKDRISTIAATAAPATIRAREVAAKAYAEGKSWAMKRYSGGRIGALPPNQSNRMFDDSGRLAKSVAVGATSEGYTINVASNRFDPNTLNGGEAALTRIFQRLRELVPELANPRLLMDSIPVRRAVNEATAAMLQKADERGLELKLQKMQAAIGAVKQFLSLVA